MNIISIDNAYEDDGLANVYSFLAGLNAEAADAPDKRRLVAITPEYDETGRLQRLNCITVLAKAAPSYLPPLGALETAATEVALNRKAAHDAAIAKLEEPIVVPLDPSGV